MVRCAKHQRAARGDHFAADDRDLAGHRRQQVADQSLEQALGLLVRQDRSGLPVTTTDGRILGWLTHRDVLAAYHTRLQHGVARAKASPDSTATESSTWNWSPMAIRVADAGGEWRLGLRRTDPDRAEVCPPTNVVGPTWTPLSGGDRSARPSSRAPWVEVS